VSGAISPPLAYLYPHILFRGGLTGGGKYPFALGGGRFILFGTNGPIKRGSAPSPSMGKGGADRGRYVMCVAVEELPSPLTGEGSGGGDPCALSPIPTFTRVGEVGNEVS
jgi:hypothetical protein